MQYGQELPEKVSNKMQEVYHLGNSHALLCADPTMKTLHDQIKEQVVAVFAEVIGNLAQVGLTMDVWADKLRELGVDPDSLVPDMGIDVTVITMPPGAEMIPAPSGAVAFIPDDTI